MTHINEFLKSVTVLDTETTNMIPEHCEIVEVAGATYNNHWNTKNLLLGAYNGIPAAASAKNNISNKMIAGLPTFDKEIQNVQLVLNWPYSAYFVAHNVNYDRKALKTAFQRMNSETDVELCNDARRWICTWRLSKHILTHNFNDIQYGLGYLRYRLDLPIDDSLRAHRADIDTIVCAALLEKLIDLAIEYNQIDQHLPIGPQLNELCWSFIPITTWPIGKHRGTLLTDLDNDYYVWALGNLPRLDGNNSEYDADLAESVRIVLSKRLEEM